jgi:hypothetical protein
VIEGIPQTRYKTSAATLACTDRAMVFRGQVVIQPRVMRRILAEWQPLRASYSLCLDRN